MATSEKTSIPKPAVEEVVPPNGKKSQTQYDDNEGGPLQLDNLLCDEISKSDLTRLKDAGLCVVEAVAFSTIRNLTSIRGISEAKAKKLHEKAKKLCPVRFCTSSEMHAKRSDLVVLTTGSRELDKLLQGGIETGSMVEIFGESKSGKTQFVHTLCVTCQLPISEGGAEGKAMYIDTDGSFRPERLLGIASRFGLNGSEVLDNVIFARVYNSEQQSEILISAAALMSESRFALLVVDSASAHFRNEFTGRGELYDRQSRLSAFLRTLRRLCDEYGIACVYTNEVVSDVSGVSFMGPTVKPVGGNVMAHAANTRLGLRKARGDNRVCKVHLSPILPEAEAVFSITAEGINDAKE